MANLEDVTRNLASYRAEVAHAEDMLDLLDVDVAELKRLLGLHELKRLLGMR